MTQANSFCHTTGREIAAMESADFSWPAMAPSNPLFRAARENDRWTSRRATSAARKVVHRMNNGNLIKTALRVDGMSCHRIFRSSS